MSSEAVTEFWSSPPQSLHKTGVVAEVIQVTAAKLERDRWLRQGIPCVRHGRQVRYRKSDIEKYLRAHTDIVASA
jgi:hypothetical protein